ncbi:MAG: hypothetical protein RL372_1325 [Bacteroidota bacterium]|jgi:hypothetical protein
MKLANTLLTIMFLALISGAKAQELQARVTVLSNRVATTVDRKIFTTLQTQLTNLLNNRKWTSDLYRPHEKIECSFILNIESIVEANVYKATLSIQAARPVYGSSYKASMVNFQDPDVTFKYQEFQPLEFNEARVQGTDAGTANLPAIFAYYAYMMIGLDYDSFALKGGESYFRKALNIVNNAPEGKGVQGWKMFDGLRNRFWLVENVTNNRNNLIHDVFYGYYRNGLDHLMDNEEQAHTAVLAALIQLQTFAQENQNSMIQQFFLQSKFAELSGIFKKAKAEDKQKALELLTVLDAANAPKYKEALQ